MFGSLIIVFPSPHEGGALLLRHRNQEWTFDFGGTIAAGEDQPSIGYVAFFNDVEHEVTPVTSGHRITLTYNLYFDHGGPVSSNDAVPEHFNSPRPPNQVRFREAFAALLENPEFLADGGTLAFGLRHVYPIQNGLDRVYKTLKGSDSMVYQSVLALGYEPVLYVYYQDREFMIDKVVDFPNWMDSLNSISRGVPTFDEVMLIEGGILAHSEGEGVEDDSYEIEMGMPEGVEWATPEPAFNSQVDGSIDYIDDHAGIDWAVGDVCLIVRVGKVGDRLTYRTVAQLGRASKNSVTRRNLRVQFQYEG
jgi:hypothetical protein